MCSSVACSPHGPFSDLALQHVARLCKYYPTPEDVVLECNVYGSRYDMQYLCQISIIANNDRILAA